MLIGDVSSHLERHGIRVLGILVVFFETVSLGWLRLHPQRFINNEKAIVNRRVCSTRSYLGTVVDSVLADQDITVLLDFNDVEI